MIFDIVSVKYPIHVNVVFFLDEFLKKQGHPTKNPQSCAELEVFKDFPEGTPYTNLRKLM